MVLYSHLRLVFIKIYYIMFIYSYCITYKYMHHRFSIIIYIDMLTEVHQTPSQNGACFHDYLTNATYFLKDSLLTKYHPETGQQNISFPFNRKTPITSLDQSLPRLARVYGHVIINSEGTFASSSSSEECMVKATNPITDFMCWEFYFPVSLIGVELGVFSVEPNGIRNEISFEFVSSTSRTVTMMAQQGKVFAWVNKSVPLKNHSKSVDYQNQKEKWYPYVKFKAEGTTAVFNPFATSPSEKISNFNPFNSYNSDKPTIQNKFQKFQNRHVSINQVKQLNKDKVFLKGQNNYYKVLLRNKETNEFHFPKLQIEGNTVKGLWEPRQYEKVKNYCEKNGHHLFENSEFHNIEYIFQNIKYLVQNVDKKYKVQNHEIAQILLEKLLLIRPYIPEQAFPNPIYVNNLDYENHHYSKIFFEEMPTIFRLDSMNEESWVQIEGKLVDLTQNYACFLKEDDSVELYHLGNQIKKVLGKKIEGKFDKESFLQNYSQKQVRVFKQNNSAPHVFKILSNCLVEKKDESLFAFEPKDKNIEELVRDFKIQKQEAVVSLRECETVEEALVWLSNPKRKITRSVGTGKEKLKQEVKEEKKRISIIEIEANPIVRVLLQIQDQVYAIGLSPKDLAHYVHQTEKGVINLSTFTHELSISDLNTENWYSSLNHKELCVLDSFAIPQEFKNILCIFREEDDFMIGYDEGGVLMKVRLVVNEKRVFSSKNCFEIKDGPEPLSTQFVEFENINRTVSSELMYSENWKGKQYKDNIVIHLKDKIFSNIAGQVQSHVQITAEFPQLPALFKEKACENSTYIPLLVEKGPPGCNLNYPICSILYPKNPFLANYPYSLTLRNLHNKFMKVKEVVIERIGKRKNVNEVKQGYIYFSNGSGVESRKYKFVFDACEKENTLTVKIEEQNYWKYMIIDPIYATGKKMPYEIGFVGAKGKTIDAEHFSSVLCKYMEKNSSIENGKLQILNQKSVGNNAIQFNALVPENADVNKIKTKYGNVVKVMKKRAPHRREEEKDKIKNIHKLKVGEFLKILAKERKSQLEVLKNIQNDESFNFDEFGDGDVRRFMDILHFHSNLKPSSYENILHRLLKNEKASIYLKEIIDMIGDYGLSHNFMPTILGLCSKEDLQKILKKSLDKISKCQQEQYSVLHKNKIPNLLLENYFYSPFYLEKINSSSGSSTCQEIYDDQEIKNLSVISVKEDYFRKLIVKFDQKYAISNIVLRVDKSEMHLKSVVNIYKYEGDKKVRLNAFFIHEHQWIQIMKNPYQQEMMEMFGENKGWLNGYGIGFENQKIEAQYLEIEILFTVSGVVAERSEDENIPFVDIVPEFYGNKLEKNAAGNKKLQGFFNIKEEEKFFLSEICLSNLPFKKYLVSKNSNIEYHYYESDDEKVTDLMEKMKQKIKNGEYETAVSLQNKIIKKTKEFTAKPGLDQGFTLLIWVLERLDYNVSSQFAQKLVEVIIKKQIGPIQDIALKCVCPHIDALIKSLPYIPDQIPKIENLLLSSSDITNVLRLGNSDLSLALTKLIVKNCAAQIETIGQVINLSESTNNHQMVMQYIRCSNMNEMLNNSQIISYLAEVANKKALEEHLLKKMSANQLEMFIMRCKKQGIKSINYGSLLNRLFNIQSLKSISLDLVPLLFEEKEEHWHNLEKCITLCPQAEHMIYSQYLSHNREQAEQMIQLITFHRQILHSSAKSSKSSELFAAFLSELFFVDKNLFIDVVLNLPKEINNLHEDIFDTIVLILQQECMIGGIQGAKLATFTENKWLSVMLKLLKISPAPKEIDEETLVRWYLSNNDYELIATNPVNRSASVNEIKEIGEIIKELLSTKSLSISAILSIYTQMKEKIKNNHNKLLSCKHIELNRLQYGVEKLVNKNVDSQELTEVLMGKDGNKGIFHNILNELEMEIKGDGSSKWENFKEAELSEDMEGFSLQGQKMQNLNVKDWQSYKTGSKSVTCKVSLTAKKLLLKPKQPLNMNKFAVGFNIQDNVDKNNILPDTVELFGGSSENNLQKICDLEIIDDQHFHPFGVKVFGINFNKISRKYRNDIYNCLQLRIKTLAHPSCSDVLENYQKNLKNAIYNISFISIVGHEEQPTSEPSYTSIYMKLLFILSLPEYSSALKTITETHKEEFSVIFPRLIKILGHKSWEKKNKILIQQLLIALSKSGQSVLEQLIKQPECNNELVKILLSSNLTTQNLDIVLRHTLDKNLTEEAVNDITEEIKIASYHVEKPKPSKYFDEGKVRDLLKQKNQKLTSKILSCMLSSKELYPINHKKLVEEMMENENNSYYPILASFVYSNQECLDWFLNSGKLEKIKSQLLKKMENNNSSEKLVQDTFEEIYLLTALATYSSIKANLINSKFPLQVLNKIQNKTSLLIQYPKETMKYFISLFQSTCIQSLCAEEFAAQLIDLMVKLPEISSTYHQYFIHQFFFPLINAYTGAPVTFIWRGVNQEPLSKVTQILQKLPIRTNDKIVQHELQYYMPVDNNWSECSSNSNLLLRKGDESVAFRKKGEWQPMEENLKVKGTADQWKLVINEEEVNLKENSDYALMIETKREKTLLTNQTLLRIRKPTLFGKKYKSQLPPFASLSDHLYLLPLQMPLNDVIKQFNICGFRVNADSIKNIMVKNRKNGRVFPLETKIGQIFGNEVNPFVELELQAHSIFRDATIEKIAKSDGENVPPFIPQETIFKSFEKLKGLQKMIKVLMTCVKNWSNQEQSKIWLQYLNELESFSCFPVFSSIYMTKQSNVQLLFDLLSGLPDKEEPKKWTEEEKKAVRFLYDIIKNVFEVQGQQAIIIRNYAIQSGFYQTMLERLHLVTKEPKRFKNEEEEEEEEEIQMPKLAKKDSEDQYKKQLLKKKKGIGYGTDSSSNQKWDISGHEEARKEQSNQILGLLKILQKFLSHPKFSLPKELLEATFSSCLLPVLQSSLRGGSLLQISKYAELFTGQLSFVKAIAKNSIMVPCLMQIPKDYEPKQSQSIHSLLKTLEGTSKIFLSCLTGSVSEKTSEEIAKNIIETFQFVDNAISKYKIDNVDEDEERRILELPLNKKYPLLMKDLRFDYVDMKDKNGKMKHHYSSSYTTKHTSPAAKTIRLAQQLADISHALPIDHTNAIFVRCDKQRVDFMQALIMGSNGTPYGHGAYLFDIHFEDSYPNNPPKVNLTTTGSGSIRFNPNLYNCGKVCLSLLGTWRGSAMQNWDPKVSTLLQVLVSIQSIIMSEEVYFNEPGFEHEQGTVEGEKKNEAYSNVVRYGNIKFAMLENLKNPPKGFETVIRRHFYLKKTQILEECRKWERYAEKRQASYTGLVSDHNHNWCNTFNKSKKQYSTMLSKAIKELEQELNKLPEPSSKDLKKNEVEQQKKEKKKKVKVEEKEEVVEEIDVTYEQNKTSNYKQLDINDEKVKDRWSRYIGAMGIEAVSKQSKANILLFGLDALGIQIAKNLVLSGCRKLGICEPQAAKWNDLSGQFYLSEEDVGKNRVQACLYKLQELNNYVRVESVKVTEENHEDLKEYHLVITTAHTTSQLFKLNSYCRQNGIKFIVVKSKGPYGYVFNDFGENFEVTDKNGEETVEVMIENITNEEQGVVKLLNGQRHSYEDGQAVRISEIKGMAKKNVEGQSINGTIHKIKVINQHSFSIGNTTEYTPYEGNGTARNMKLPISVNFKSLENTHKDANIDGNLEYYDFSKGVNNRTLHLCFKALNQFVEKNKKQPRPWNWEDSEEMLELVKAMREEALEENDVKYVRKYSFTCSGTFSPLCAFYGGLIAQEAFKAITSKYMPINQYFFTDFTQVIQQMPKELEEWKEFVEKINYQPKQDRLEGLRTIVGDQILQKVRSCRVFVVGSGAIGCELLKNYAMINLATAEDKGQIIVTDPDHIETSNLNRQFLFREKHLQKPKSMTAAAAAKQMNKLLKGKIKAKLTKVCEATKDIFSNEFFEDLNIVTNALDNVQARQYVDMRCVENKVALLESGTLSSKGHVQVIVPYKTETYGSKADPAEEGDIPHCTLKMFPEEALHCVEWARDIFGKTFTLKPKALTKIIQSIDTYNPTSSEKQVLEDSLKMLEDRPKNFDDCVFIATQQFYQLYRNDIKQLLYTYPLDAKTKDGKPFWKLPKRPPTPVEEINPQSELHGQFITSYAVLLSKNYNIPYPKDFRTVERRLEISRQAAKIKIDPFVPSDKLAKEMESEVEQKEDKEEVMEEVGLETDGTFDEVKLFKEIKLIVQEEKSEGNQIKILAEEFEKDQDGNGHIDLIYSMANLRVENYKLEPMDWITTKLKAGRITPALSTTTSCIAALQTIELIKYLKGCTVQEMRNSFINLAVPMVQTGEPGQVEKIKIHQNLTTNIWERWQVEPVNYKQIKMGQLIKKIEQKYSITVKVLNILESGPIFSDLVLGLESKKAEKEAFMKKKFADVINEEGSLDEIKNFIDLTVLIGDGEEIVKHVPTLRVPLN